MRISKKVAFAAMVAGLSVVGGSVLAGQGVQINPPGNINFKCSGGMTSHAHLFETGMTVFEGDPEVEIQYHDIEFDGVFSFRIEEISTGSHAGTHIDVPSHFIETEARSLEELGAEEFVWPAYVIDVRDLRESTDDGFQLSPEQIRNYEDQYGRIQPGSLVILQTGQEEFFDDPGLFLGENPGLAGEAVQWLFDERGIAGTGSDAYGPDASSDELFDATFTTLANDGVAVVALKNLDDLAIQGDLLFAPAVPVSEGSGFPVNPISCQGNKSGPRDVVPAGVFD